MVIINPTTEHKPNGGHSSPFGRGDGGDGLKISPGMHSGTFNTAKPGITIQTDRGIPGVLINWLSLVYQKLGQLLTPLLWRGRERLILTLRGAAEQITATLKERLVLYFCTKAGWLWSSPPS